MTGERLVHLVGFGCLWPFLNLLACFQACPNHCQKRQAVMRCKQEGEQTSCRCSFSYFAHQPSLLHDFSGMDAWARLQTLTNTVSHPHAIRINFESSPKQVSSKILTQQITFHIIFPLWLGCGGCRGCVFWLGMVWVITWASQLRKPIHPTNPNHQTTIRQSANNHRHNQQTTPPSCKAIIQPCTHLKSNTQRRSQV